MWSWLQAIIAEHFSFFVFLLLLLLYFCMVSDKYMGNGKNDEILLC